MSPNNFVVTETETTTSKDDCQLDNVPTIFNRKTKNLLNAREMPRDMNGNILGGSDSLPSEYRIQPAWFNIIGFIYLHATLIQSLFYVHLDKTFAFAFIIGLSSGFGITAGAHRLWAHGAYKANMKMKVMLLIFQTLAFQNSVIEWVRDHRVHHKFTDTNADPHNASRGFFFSHMGWLMCKKHPDVKKYGEKVNISDLTSDPLLAFQHKYFLILMPITCFLLPAFIPWYFWGESFYKAYVVAGILRYVIVLHITWLINSAAHMFGDKPYDRYIRPVDTWWVSFLAFGEGFHNYHHVFPWDYRTSEFGLYWCNFTNIFLDYFTWLGWATDLKTVSKDMIFKRALRTGDGSHTEAIEHAASLKTSLSQEKSNRDVDHFWGWADELLTEEDKKIVTIINKTEN